MRRILFSAALAALLAAVSGGTAVAAPPSPPPPVPSDGWSIDDGRLSWRADRRVPMGDAAVEFWSGDKLLGRARPAPDGRTFTLSLDEVRDLDDLAVRAGGRRLDQPAPAATRRAAPTAELPAPLPANRVDPGLPGPYATVRGEYALDPIALPGMPAPVEMQAVVVAPRNAAGPRPLALFLHGRHSVCYRGSDEVPQEWPCPAGAQPIPSYRGYLQAQQLLASQGYVTVSISANGINAQDWDQQDQGAQARSTLVRRHLTKWADWAGTRRGDAPQVVRDAPRADLSRVLLVGHSRGGEGVSRAATDTLTPPPAETGAARWRIRGLLLIGPTIFGHNPTPDVPSATILPGCDGDVFDLQGQLYVDETRGVSRGRALHSSVYLIGANHNFFNTEWTPGQSAAPSWDDSPDFDGYYDPVCSPTRGLRLTPTQQQTAGATYIAAAARLFVAGDDRVRPLLDGTGVRAPSADPARALSHALGGLRTPLLAADPSLRLSGGARLCAQVAEPDRSCIDDPAASWPYLTHFAALWQVIPEAGRHAAELIWSSPGKPIRLTPPRPVRTAASQALTLRLMVPPNAAARFDVAVVGRDGRRTALGEVRLTGLPGSVVTLPYWAQEVRAPLRGVREVAALELTPRGAGGRAWLLDAWGWSPGTPDPQPVALPRVDVGEIQAVEGDSGERAYRVPVSVTGNGAGRVRLFLFDTLTEQVRSWTATVRPGDRSVPVTVRIRGDEIFGVNEAQQLFVKAERGLQIGDYLGGVDVLDDDPAPRLTVDSPAARTAEGGTLAWTLRMSAPAESPLWRVAVPRAPAAGAELSTTDVDPDWFTEGSWEPIEPSRPLSQTELWVFTQFPAGETVAQITIPTVSDGLTEPDEFVELDLQEPALPALTGVVTGG